MRFMPRVRLFLNPSNLKATGSVALPCGLGRAGELIISGQDRRPNLTPRFRTFYSNLDRLAGTYRKTRPGPPRWDILMMDEIAFHQASGKKE